MEFFVYFAHIDRLSDFLDLSRFLRRFFGLKKKKLFFFGEL